MDHIFKWKVEKLSRKRKNFSPERNFEFLFNGLSWRLTVTLLRWSNTLKVGLELLDIAASPITVVFRVSLIGKSTIFSEGARHTFSVSEPKHEFCGFVSYKNFLENYLLEDDSCLFQVTISTDTSSLKALSIEKIGASTFPKALPDAENAQNKAENIGASTSAKALPDAKNQNKATEIGASTSPYAPDTQNKAATVSFEEIGASTSSYKASPDAQDTCFKKIGELVFKLETIKDGKGDISTCEKVHSIWNELSTTVRLGTLKSDVERVSIYKRMLKMESVMAELESQLKEVKVQMMLLRKDVENAFKNEDYIPV